MDVNLIPWTQDGIAGCYLKLQDGVGDPTGTLYKLEGMNSFDTQRNVTERKLLGDNTTYMINSKFSDFAVTANFYGLIVDLMDCFLSGIKTVVGDIVTFDETVTGQPRKVVLYQVSDAIGKNGETGQTLETYWDAQVTNLTNPKASGELVTWQSTIAALAKLRAGILTPRQFKFVKNGVALPAASGDSTPPAVTTTTPVQGATAIPVTTNITAVFSENVDEGSLANVVLVRLSDGTLHALGAPTYNAATFTAVWDPPTNLSAASSYLFTVEGGKVKDVGGNYLVGDVHRTFTTA